MPYASYLIFGEQTVGDALWAQMNKVWANFKPRKVKATRTNWNIRTKGDAAYVTFTTSALKIWKLRRFQKPSKPGIWRSLMGNEKS